MRNRAGTEGALLMVANYRPDVGFAWWLMEHFWVELAALGREYGLEPLIAFPEPGRIPEGIRNARIETMIEPFPGRGLKGLARAAKLVRSRRVRLIYFTDRGFTSITYLLFRLLGVRVILNHDHTPGDRPEIGGIKGFLKAAWRRLPLLSCDLQICVAPIIQERAIRNARIPAHRTVVVQNGIEPVTCGEDRTYAQREFGFPPDALLCVNVGRAHPYKRLDFFIEVARICVLERGLEKLYFLHCGDGPDLKRLKQLAVDAGVAPRLVFAGRRSDVPEILCSATFALHPARGEAFSLAIVEYMSAGLVVLVPNVPSVCQAITNGVDGVVFDDGDAEEAASHIEKLVPAPERRRSIQTMASRKIRERFSLNNMDRQFHAVVRMSLEKIPAGRYSHSQG
jgi:glycosyltransferase involved in cell wall biosynthesis